MKTRDQLKRDYKDHPPAMGIFLVHNTARSRFVLGASRNVEGSLNKHRFMLGAAKPGDPHVQADLLADYRDQAGAGFEFTVLDVLKPKAEPGWDPEEDLKTLEQLWRQELLTRGWSEY